MVNSALHFPARPDDFGFQNGDARFQFGDRQRVQILAHQFGERIARPFRENLVQIHRMER